MDITYYKKYEPVFGSWKIVREIGEGSFGKVFEIEREDFGRTYKAALKAVTIPQSQSEIKSAMADGMDQESVTTYFRGFVEEIVDEFAIMSQLKGHSNVVSYEDHVVVQHDHDIGWDILIRMELLTPLVDYVQQHTLSTDEVVKLGIDMCKALEACRYCHIIHRDIKPENIFVSQLGDYKLGDFGIAKTVEKTMGGLSKKGTYTYMAPEVYKGEEYGPSVDIYSLGIVLYRYLNNNRTPFLNLDTVPTYKEKEKSIIRRINGEELPVPANADEYLGKIILKACAYKPEDRYASPTEMREDLEAIASGAIPAHVAISVHDDVTVKEPVAVNGGNNDATVGIFGRSIPHAASCEEDPTGKNTPPAEASHFVAREVSPDTDDKTTAVFSPASYKRFEADATYQTCGTESEPTESATATVFTTTNNKDEATVPEEKTVAEALPKEKNKKKTLIIAAALLLVVVAAIGIMTARPWTDIIAVSAGELHTVGLRSDGTVVATGDNVCGQCDVSGWTDIVSVSAGGWHTVGLRSDGTVVATGANDVGQCDVSGWTDIVSVSAEDWHTVGLRSDGTVVATGENDDGQCNVSGWTDIVAVSAGYHHTVGLRSDGTVVATGENGAGQCVVTDWTGIAAIINPN